MSRLPLNDDTLSRYSDFAPTCFDTPGLCAATMADDDRSAWFVAPCSVTRDSESLSRANWQAQEKALADVDPDGNDHEEHTFGHWGPGWFSIVLVRPDTAAHREALSLAGALADYPVVDDMLLSEVEHDDECESWANYAARDFLDELRRALSLREENVDRIDATDSTNDRPRLYDLFTLACRRANVYVEHDNEGTRFPLRRAATAVDARSLAEYLRRCGAGEAIR